MEVVKEDVRQHGVFIDKETFWRVCDQENIDCNQTDINTFLQRHLVDRVSTSAIILLTEEPLALNAKITRLLSMGGEYGCHTLYMAMKLAGSLNSECCQKFENAGTCMSAFKNQAKCGRNFVTSNQGPRL